MILSFVFLHQQQMGLLFDHPTKIFFKRDEAHHAHVSLSLGLRNRLHREPHVCPVADCHGGTRRQGAWLSGF
jgi:hypothetical protein